MPNYCVSCGSEIPDEGGSMVCKLCADKSVEPNYELALELSLVSPKKGEFIVAQFDGDKATIEDVRNDFDTLKRLFKNRQVILVPSWITIKSMNLKELKELVRGLKKFIRGARHDI